MWHNRGGWADGDGMIQTMMRRLTSSTTVNVSERKTAELPL